MTDIFISYAKEDRALATRLSAELREAGWEVYSQSFPYTVMTG